MELRRGLHRTAPYTKPLKKGAGYFLPGSGGDPPDLISPPRPGGYRGLIKTISAFSTRPLRKRCRILPAGGLGVPPGFNKSPKIGGLGG